MEAKQLKRLLMWAVSAMHDIDPTGKEGVPETPIFMVLQEKGVGARDWALLLSTLTDPRVVAGGKEPICRQKGHTLYLTASGRKMGEAVNKALEELKAAG